MLDRSEEIVQSEGSDKILKALEEANSRLRDEKLELLPASDPADLKAQRTASRASES